MALTKKQRQILDFVETFVQSNGYSPSYEEIADAFEYSSLATVHEHLTNLETKGFLRKNYNKSRSLELVPAEGTLAVDLPLLGSVAAGLPIEAIESNESLAVPQGGLAPLGPQQNAGVNAAWTSSIEHISHTPGFPDGRWPDAPVPWRRRCA